MDKPIDLKILEYKQNIINAVNDKSNDIPIIVKQMVLNEIKINLDRVVVQILKEELDEANKNENEEKSEGKIDE